MALGYGLIATHLTFGPLNWNQGTSTHCASYRLVWSMIKPYHYQGRNRTRIGWRINSPSF
jgi:hypothetical protein